MAACCQSLSAMQFEWDTVLQVLQLPPACSELEVFASLYSSAGKQLQQQLGDLEVAWASDEGRERFLALPLKGVELLLGDKRTRVAYENTVLVATTTWVQQHSSSLTPGDTKRLAELIRLPHITPLFASSVLPFLPWLTEALGAGTVALSMGLATIAGCSTDPNAKVRPPSPNTLTWPGSWGLGRRPPSQLKALRLEWAVSLQDLETVFKGGGAITSHSAGFGGLEWNILLNKKAHAAGGHSLGLFAALHHPKGLQLQASAQAAIMLTETALVCEAPATHAAAALARTNVGTCGLQDGSLGWTNFWGTGSMIEWQPQLFEKWADSEGRLKLQLNVSKFM